MKEDAIERLVAYVKEKGIMFTLRYIVEREEYFGIIHLTKLDAVEGYRDDLDELVANLIKKADKALTGRLEMDAATGKFKA